MVSVVAGRRVSLASVTAQPSPAAGPLSAMILRAIVALQLTQAMPPPRLPATVLLSTTVALPPQMSMPPLREPAVFHRTEFERITGEDEGPRPARVLMPPPNPS